MSFVVVVGMDGSRLSELALERAVSLSEQHPGAVVHVVNVVDGYDPMGRMEYAADRGALDLSKERAALDARLEALRVSRSGLPELVPHVLAGPPAKEIVRVASHHDADAIVVGTHGRRGVERLMLGSVAAEILKVARCSVLVVREKHWKSDPAS
ncbi:MAG: universal stress protein [Myxococcales bacterium]|nr:universal stress protein [Myxococcales bacterium]